MNPAATDALARWREEHQGEVKTTRNPYQKWQDRDTRATAIAALCWGCMGGDADYATGVREEIRRCSCGPDSERPCPLYNWRPYK